MIRVISLIICVGVTALVSAEDSQSGAIDIAPPGQNVSLETSGLPGPIAPLEQIAPTNSPPIAGGEVDGFVLFGPGDSQDVIQLEGPAGMTGFRRNTRPGGTYASELGLIYTTKTPRLITGRIGVGGTFGTHTVLGDTQIGIAGSIPLRSSYFDYNFAQNFGVLSKQWSYDFPGIEFSTSFEGVWRLPLDQQESRFLGFGWRGQSFNNKSWAELNGQPPGYQQHLSILGQRIGTVILQYDWRQAELFQRVRFEFSNDTDAVGGTGEDEFRTALVRLSYLRQDGDTQYRIGGVVDLFTGRVDRTQVEQRSDGEYYVRDNVDFADWSQGFIGLQLGVSRFHNLGTRMTGEAGFNLFVGPDTEGIRNFHQNVLVHKPLDIPQVPTLDRDDRFRFDVRVFYVVHFGAN